MVKAGQEVKQYTYWIIISGISDLLKRYHHCEMRLEAEQDMSLIPGEVKN